MKIIRVSNYDDESEAQYVIAENIKNKVQAEIMCYALQEDSNRTDRDWFKVVEDDYKLWCGMEDLV